MSYPKAILFSAFILASAIIFANISPVSSQSRGGAYYTLAGDSGQFVWRLNMTTGELSYCARRDNTVDPTVMAKRPPYCSAATAPLQ